MRVLFITRKWPPAVGGMETYSVELTRELSKICDLTVRALPGRPDGRPPSIASLARFMLSSILAVAAGKRVDVVHVGDLVLWPIIAVAQLFQRSASSVVTAHGLDVVYGVRRGVGSVLYRPYLFLGVRLCGKRARVIAVSRSTAERCLAIGFQNVVVVPNGVRLQSWVTEEVGRGEPYVLFVGRLVRRKGVRWFIESVLPLLDSRIRFVVVGRKKDESEWRAISNNPRVEYLGAVSDDELRRLRVSALAVVMPNIHTDGRDIEGFGLAAVEAAADGGVLLASGIEGIVDAVADGETGFLLPAEDRKAWADRIAEVSRWTPEARDEFVRKARAVIADRYSWSRVARETLSVCRGRVAEAGSSCG